MKRAACLLPLLILAVGSGPALAQFGQPIPVPPPLPPPPVLPPPVFSPLGGPAASPPVRHAHDPGMSDAFVALVIGGGAALVVILLALYHRHLKRLRVQMSFAPRQDRVYTVTEVARKAIGTEILLEKLAQVDPAMDPGTLTDWVRSTFLLAQHSREARDESAVRDRLGQAMARRHRQQIRELRRCRMVNRIDHLDIDRIEFVQLYYPAAAAEERSLTALITYQACISYRGESAVEEAPDDRPVQMYQEFWVFRPHGDVWVLAEIELTDSSNRLRYENFVDVPLPKPPTESFTTAPN